MEDACSPRSRSLRVETSRQRRRPAFFSIGMDSEIDVDQEVGAVAALEFDSRQVDRANRREAVGTARSTVAEQLVDDLGSGKLLRRSG